MRRYPIVRDVQPNGRSKCSHSDDPRFWTLNKPIANSKTCLCGQILSMNGNEKEQK
jgi:hypothetical protein